MAKPRLFHTERAVLDCVHARAIVCHLELSERIVTNAVTRTTSILSFKCECVIRFFASYLATAWQRRKGKFYGISDGTDVNSRSCGGGIGTVPFRLVSFRWL